MSVNSLMACKDAICVSSLNDFLTNVTLDLM